MDESGDESADQGESLNQKHKREKKELQAQIQKLKHSVPKGDKKKKKEVTEQIARLEADLDKKHEEELRNAEKQVNEATQKLELDSAEDKVDKAVPEADKDVNTAKEPKEKKTSKAGKRREKKAQKDREREERIKEQDIENLSGVRNVESQQLKSLLKQRGLQVYEIPSDGNCLYNAISHQLQNRGITETNESLRAKAAQFMRDHQDDFMPFLTKDNGDFYSLEDFEQYCTELANTSAWGGHLETKALSHVLHLPIEILQASGPPVKLGDEFENGGQRPVTLTYHRHAYGLGEHYNSVQDYQEEEENF